MKNKKTKHHFYIPRWLGAILIGILILRIPSFFEPYYYGDEMIYLSLGEGIRKGLVLYSQIHDNKPPLLYFLAALSGNLFWFKAILALWMMGATVIFWKLAKKVLIKEPQVLASTFIFALLTTLPLLEGNIVNAELFIVGLSALGFLFALGTKLTNQKIILAGICFSLAALFKIPAAFDVGAVVIYWLITTKDIKSTLKHIIILGLAFVAPILLTFVWYALRGALSEYFIAAFAQNFGYLSSWRASAQEIPFLEKNGPLLLRGFIVLTGVVILFFLRNKISKAFLLSSLWLLFTLFAVTLSERPYPHYLVQSIPAISLLVGILVASIKMEQPWAIIPLALAFAVPVYFKFYYYNTFSYYSRFVNFATGKISQEEYLKKFDQNLPQYYQISQYLNETSFPSEKVFVWGDSPTVYALSRRLPPLKYVATYHINDFSSKEEVMEKLYNDTPAFVVVLPGSQTFEGLSDLLSRQYLLVKSYNGAMVWSKINPRF